MSSYVASARIVHAVPRLARSNRSVERAIEGAPALPVEDLIVEADPLVASAWGRVAELATAAGERWSQLTFYLFDPNSWR
jgi:hypothetical protein